ncbi:hypothetical protein FGO68_gene3823 [Halteria grandinella]|uniref:Uncharacterized protein n=1 Tax=Halteria grandinella TaxID=5974 RepID=A0A8J8ND95_HALGN|nr:hypothetical protein FGO68_gene3823 [Halteria grandinella]
MNAVTPHQWNASELKMDYNFGMFSARRIGGGDIEVTLQVKNKENQVILEKKLLKSKHLTIDQNKLRYPDLCMALHSKQERVLQLNHYTQNAIIRKSGIDIALVAGFTGFLCIPVASVVRIIGGLLKMIRKRLQTKSKGE